MHKFNSRQESKRQHKIQKKRSEAYETILRIEGTDIFSEQPSGIICVVNIGHSAAGVATTSQLEKVFSKYNGLKQVAVPSTKPYSFAVFDSVDQAQVAHEGVEGAISPEFNNKPLFVEYVSLDTFTKLTHTLVSNPKNAAVVGPQQGLYYFPDFITPAEESQILQHIRQIEQDGPEWQRIQERFIKHFGYEFDYQTKQVSNQPLSDAPVPSWMLPFIERISQIFDNFQTPDMLTIQRYPPGAGIAFHCDSHVSFTDTIVILSMGTPVQMDFRQPSTDKLGTQDLGPRSLVIISGDVRYGWEHAIRIRKSDLVEGQVRRRSERWSITFRTVNQLKTCACGFHELCNS